LAYLDTFTGLIPCRVLGWDLSSLSFRDGARLLVKVTADRGAFCRGEVLSEDPWHVVPRDMIRRRSGQLRICTTYVWEPPSMEQGS